VISRLRLKVGMLGAAFFIVSLGGLLSARAGSEEIKRSLSQTTIPILVYHRFGPVVADGMTVTTHHFESHIKYLKENGYTIISLRDLVDAHLGKRKTLPHRSISITVDDGHKSVYTDLFPLVKKYRFPVTLFLYPSVISNASYGMTWDQLREIKSSGMVDFQSHTYWHPNFKNEKKRLSVGEYATFVEMQLKKSKEKLERELGTQVDMLAWPFGIYDEDLIRKAVGAGYISAFTIERRHTKASDSVMALPRYMITEADKGKAFGKILGGSPCS
jgi:peptidoglycan/xylan/chitin deacetylase (PgdA/CDA1 family)